MLAIMISKIITFLSTLPVGNREYPGSFIIS